MRIIVTGGAGFIGANLVRRLVEDEGGHDVVVVDDLSSGSVDNLAGLDRVELVEGSVLDDDLLGRVVPGADAVVHLAARPSVAESVADPVASHLHNATGTVRVLEAARRAGNLHTVLASSSAVYGNHPAPRKHEELPPEPRSPYAADKLASEASARAYASCYGLPVMTFRFFNVYGPLQGVGHAYAAVIPAFVDAALAGRPLTVHGDGLQTRDFIYVESITGVIAAALRRRVTNDGPVNLAFGTRSNLLEVITALERILGRPVAAEHTAPRPGDVRDSLADSTRLCELFPEVQPVAFEEGLRRTVAWFEQVRAGEPIAGTSFAR